MDGGIKLVDKREMGGRGGATADSAGGPVGGLWAHQKIIGIGAAVFDDRGVEKAGMNKQAGENDEAESEKSFHAKLRNRWSVEREQATRKALVMQSTLIDMRKK